MAASGGVTVHGARELAAGSKRLAEEIAKGAPAAFESVAGLAAGGTRARVPRRSGALAATVEASSNEGAAMVGLGGDLPYAGWIEFGGTRGRPYVPAGRYLYPTAMDAAGQLEAAGERAAQHEIEVMRWPRPT